MLHLCRLWWFGLTRKRRERYLRGLRLEMIVGRVKGDLGTIDEHLYQILRSVRLPTLYLRDDHYCLLLPVRAAKKD